MAKLKEQDEVVDMSAAMNGVVVANDGFLTEDELFAALAGEEVEREIPGLGKVLLRSLSVTELAEINRLGKKDEAATMAHTAIAGLVKPKLAKERAGELATGKAGWVVAVAKLVMELSGLGDQDTLEKKVGPI